jgi:adenosylhomocysteine nucleosidase
MTGPPAPRLGVLTGMTIEAACLDALSGEPRPLVACSGADTARAHHRAARLIEQGAGALLSFGLAGGLAGDLAPGTLLLASAVVLADGTRFDTDRVWRDHLAAHAARRGVELRSALLAASDRVIASPAAKGVLAARTGAAAVDMESHAAAAAAQAAGLPFLALRVVADPADRAIPPPALAAIAPDGRTRPVRVALRLLLAPWHLPGLLRLGRDSDAALGALSAALGRLENVGPPCSAAENH